MSEAPPTPGWYEHPAGQGSLRWWDGAAWHDQQPLVQQPPLPAGTTTSTWSYWVMAVLPIAGLLSSVLQDPAGQIRASLQRGLEQVRNPTVIPDPTAPLAQLVSPSILVSDALSLVFLAANVLLALHDSRTLRVRGIVRPMPWGWAFLQPVYVIGRSVVVRCRVHGSLTPLRVYIGVTVVSTVVIFTVVGIALSAALSSLT